MDELDMMLKELSDEVDEHLSSVRHRKELNEQNDPDYDKVINNLISGFEKRQQMYGQARERLDKMSRF